MERKVKASRSKRRCVDSQDLINTLLPRDLILKIFYYLSVKSIGRCAQVSRYWKELAYEGQNWHTVECTNRIREQGVEDMIKRCGVNLKRLRFFDCQRLTDELVLQLCKNCCNLEILYMEMCHVVTDKTLKALGKWCHNLSHLSLHRSDRFTDWGLAALSKRCKSLGHIKIGGEVDIGFDGIESLAKNCTSLNSFSAHDCSVDMLNDVSLRLLCEHRQQLEKIELLLCEGVTNTGLMCIADNCHRLLEFTIQSYEPSDEGLIAISRGCPKLEYFSAIETDMSDESIKALSRNCPNLQRIEIFGLYLTDDSLKSIGANCRKLKHLWIYDSDITDDGLTAIGEGCTSLQHIALKGCNKIRPGGIENLIKKCDSLVGFRLNNCDEMTINDNSLKALCQHLHKLKYINLDYCPGITDLGDEYLKKYCPQLTYRGWTRGAGLWGPVTYSAQRRP